MTLPARQIELVQKTWNQVLTHKSEAGEIFYDRLFALDPSLRPLFKKDISTQAAQLINMISFAVNKLDNIHTILADIKALGFRHKLYNVQPEHYNTVGEALLWTLEKGLADAWTAETKAAWLAVYTLLSSTMIEAANENQIA